ncbi:MAG: SpoIIE family protein phosphatase [Bacteroidales bacterium]|nr:SpoIIE family protein phosphatase [Bacteroidales bacterium]MDD4383753.1 SpoIIE family protein phosphatase [Bacteroidales bacterium]MDY0198446.1 SpoIIE family protein phosphatase [Tenuifilaceae bacterium]
MPQNFFIEVNCQQKQHDGERICGDVFLSQRVSGENRTIIVLSDGMGHGVKANVLATLTATMALNFTREHKEINKIADIIMNTLPVCSVRQMSYSTFTIIDIEHNGETRILEYDNPECLILRGKEKLEVGWQCVILQSETNAGKELRFCTFTPQREDRIIAWSDGITQSGMGSKDNPFGWGLDRAQEFAIRLVTNEHNISARKLSAKLVNMGYVNDNFHPKDDISTATIYFREPRKLLICTGPPFDKENDAKLAYEFKNFNGKRVLCGATTGDIISRELGIEIMDSFEFTDPDLPPISHMEGVDLVTEGILTLGKATEILSKHTENSTLGNGPADLIVKLILESDHIDFIVGTGINIAHQDPSLPVELEIRRTVVRRMIQILEDKFLKEVTLTLL